MRVAGAPKASRFVGRGQNRTLATDPVEERRPDTRERFYDAPMEHLRDLHPCFRCFDALMHHFRGTYEEQCRALFDFMDVCGAVYFPLHLQREGSVSLSAPVGRTSIRLIRVFVLLNPRTTSGWDGRRCSQQAQAEVVELSSGREGSSCGRVCQVRPIGYRSLVLGWLNHRRSFLPRVQAHATLLGGHVQEAFVSSSAGGVDPLQAAETIVSWESIKINAIYQGIYETPPPPFFCDVFLTLGQQQ